ncbi:hypothetical protein [Streptomyces sp. NPDC089799]|uniref:hypothetical protein n=1 Tax=Streptomyces sp. NPDC089799 TaxID=3155066 RepID=UPI00342529DD
MAVSQPANPASVTSFGTRVGFIDPRRDFRILEDEDGERYVVFRFVILAVTDELFGTVAQREFTVRASGAAEKFLTKTFPEGPNGIPKEKLLVTVHVSDEQVNTYKTPKGDWIREIGIDTRSITVEPRP